MENERFDLFFCWGGGGGGAERVGEPEGGGLFLLFLFLFFVVERADGVEELEFAGRAGDEWLEGWREKLGADFAESGGVSGEEADRVEEVGGAEDAGEADGAVTGTVSKDSVDACGMSDGASSVSAYGAVEPGVCGGRYSATRARRRWLLFPVASRIQRACRANPLVGIDSFTEFARFGLAHDHSSGSQ